MTQRDRIWAGDEPPTEHLRNALQLLMAGSPEDLTAAAMRIERAIALLEADVQWSYTPLRCWQQGDSQ